MEADRSPPRVGWLILSLLLLLPPLVQGGTPRLPVLVVQLGCFGLAVHWAWTWGRAPRRELRLVAIDVALALWLFWSLFSTLFAPYYHAAEGAFLAIVCYAVLYWFLAAHPSFGGLSKALDAVRIQAALQSAIVVGQSLAGQFQRPAGTFFNPNFLAGFLAAALLLVLAGLLYPERGGNSGPRPRLRLAFGVAEAGLLATALLMSSSRGGMLAFFAGLAVLLAARSWKLLLSALASIAVVLLLVPNPFLARLQTLHLDPFSFTRLAIWRMALAMALDHPWVGIGLGQFEFVASRYAFPVTTHWARHTRVAENAHSDYLQAGAEMGLPGLLLTLVALWLIFAGAVRRLRTLAPGDRGPILGLLAGTVSLAAHTAVDFPLHTPPAALLLVLFAAGLRLHGAAGSGHVVSFRVRPLYAAAAGCLALLLAGAAVRPVVGFWYFLGGIGAPRNLLREKWSLGEAPRREITLAESARLLGLASRVDWVNAPYHRALGSRLFQAWLREEAGDDVLRTALFHVNFAAELNPNQYQYEVNLGQAYASLSRRVPGGREELAEALEHFRKAARIAPFQCTVQTDIGIVSEELGDVAAAEAAFRRAVEIEEYYLRGWFNLGTFLARQVRYAEAREIFAHGARLSENSRSFISTNDSEKELVALEPALFYNEIGKIDREMQHGGSAS